MMKKTYKFIYFLTSMCAYILLGIFEFFCMNNIVDIISEKYLYHVLFMVVALLAINPFITFYVVNKLPLKPKKRNSVSIKEDYKKQIR